MNTHKATPVPKYIAKILTPKELEFVQARKQGINNIYNRMDELKKFLDNHENLRDQ